jgi:hypothetical protein
MNRSISAAAWLAASMFVLAGAQVYGQAAAAPEPAAPAAAPEPAAPAVAPEPAAPAVAPQPAAPAAKPPEPAAPAAKPPEPAAPAAKSPASTALPSLKSPYRPLAPGVMQTIDPMRSLGETEGRHDVVELTAVDAKFDWAKDIAFRRDVWALKLQFKPMRMIWVDIPQPDGFMQRKPIWYMVYSVTNVGKIMHPVEDVPLPYPTVGNKMVYQVKEIDGPVRFLPEFLLVGYPHMKIDPKQAKAYADRVIPVAVGPIRTREDPNRDFLNTVQMCREIGVNETFWGVATWEDIDPRIVRFSVYVTGLTNAYEWKDQPGAYKPGDKPLTGRTLLRKTLQLNFWRPGDEYYEHEGEIRYGIPGDVDYQWVYR